jgi:protein TonB
MDSALTATSRSGNHAGAWSRLRLALAVSLFSHLLFLAALVTEVHQGSARAFGAVPFTVRLETLSRVPPAIAAVADPDELPVPRRMDRKEGNSRSDRWVAPQAKASTTIRAPASSLALPQVPDPTVYTARDLDTYPRPLAPLNASRLEDPASGASVSVRLELIIDERGIVNHVALAGPGPAGVLEAELRAMLAATRFIPASKDGRAVKSRVLLSVSFSPKNGER